MSSIEYNGRPEFSRERKLSEIESINQFKDRIEQEALNTNTERDDAVDALFTGLAKTYLKGNVLLDGLSKMDPAQSIPIDKDANTTRAAATRLNSDESLKGSIITYSLFQNAVNKMLDKKWELRGTYINMKVPASVEQQTKEASNSISGGSNSLIQEFISQNGIVATILGMLTMSPFQSVIFQSLTVEEGAKTIQTAQIPVGIALFLELGIKGEEILRILKGANVSTPIVELEITRLESSESARAAALSDAGFDYDDFKKSQEFTDCENIINYVTQYYTRYGGLLAPGSHLTIDHWVAYLHVAQNQQTIRGSLNTSHKFSPRFASYKEQFSKLPETQDNIYKETNKKHSNILNNLAGVTRSLKVASDKTYDDIINTFTYTLTDKDMCCLVQIFGSIANPALLQGIAVILRILATSLSVDILKIQNAMCRAISNFLQDALFELAAQINEMYYKILHKITKVFTVDFDNIPACTGMFTLGWAMIHTVAIVFDEIDALIKEITSIIGDFGNPRAGTWEVGADRRHLLGMARILETLAQRLDLANSCDLNNKKVPTLTNQLNDSNSDIDSAIFTILGSRPSMLNISEENKQKHFSKTINTTSSKLKFDYGIIPQQNNESGLDKCQDEGNVEKINKLIENLTSALNNNFNG